MTGELYECTARQLATPDPDTVQSDIMVGEAIDWLQKAGYDYAPVLDAKEPVGYVSIELLSHSRDEQPISQVMNEIRLKHVISSDAQFIDILTGLEDQPFYLLGGKNRVTGIITRADLNTSPARIHLFDRISLLEIELRKLIAELAPDWKEDVLLHPDIVEEIERLYSEAQRANIELSEIHYAGFAALVKVITHYEGCWSACGYEADHKARSDLSKIKDLRNDVVHSNLILQTTGEEDGVNGRSISDLVRLYQILIECNKILHKRTTSI